MGGSEEFDPKVFSLVLDYAFHIIKKRAEIHLFEEKNCDFPTNFSLRGLGHHLTF